MTARSRPVAPDVFEPCDGGIRLLAGRHRDDGRIVFPRPAGMDDVEPIALGRRGVLWSWTIQRFRPKSPPYSAMEPEEAFRPFAVGYVELPGEIIVESRLAAPFDALRLGLPMVIDTLTLWTDPEGVAVVTYAFRPDERPDDRAGTGR